VVCEFRVVDRRYFAVREYERSTRRSPVGCVEPERRRDVAVGVHQQVEDDPFRVGELRVNLDVVHRDAVDGDPALPELRQGTLEAVCLDGTAAGEVLG
jgi:hypothetical protein